MEVKQRTLILFGILFILSPFQERVQGIQFCGRRLADLLHLICERYGGFHAPHVRRDALNKTLDKRAVIEILQPVSHRADLGATNEDIAGSSSEELNLNYQSGIVDECCKKQCTFATMASYCANVQKAENIHLEEILSSGIENFPSIIEEGSNENQLQQVPSASFVNLPKDAESYQVLLPSQIAYSNRPNIGLSPRNRPVFIVLSQIQEDDGQALGEYRF